MALIDRQRTKHESQMHRLLTEILDDKYLAVNFYFKGGTCARMLGFLDRFSVDLDFDLKETTNKEKCYTILHNIFNKLELKVKDESKKALQFFLKYSAPEGERNTIKLEVVDKIFHSNKYESQYLTSINRTAICQTIDTMFANKLVAPLDRFESGFSIAGRDIYDIHYFFLQGYNYRAEVIEERRKKTALNYFIELKNFIEKKVTNNILDEDLNVLLEYEKFTKIRKYLKQEVLFFLDKEIKILS